MRLQTFERKQFIRETADDFDSHDYKATVTQGSEV
jgi:hypothetical protein